MGFSLGKNSKDVAGGLLMVMLGLFAIVQGSAYEIGSLTQMGSGFFPVSLGVILTVGGIVLVTMARLAPAGAVVQGHPREWKAWICILGGLVAFVVLGRYGGLVPASFAVVFISALGDRDNSLKATLLLSLAMTAIAVVIFWWALKLQLPLFGWGG